MLSIDEAIAHAREVAKEKRKEMQCKTCKLFARSDLHPLQGYCRKNEFRSIEIDSWRKVCSEYVPKEMCKCAEEHEQLADWLEELKMYKSLAPRELVSEKQKNDRAIEYSKGFNYGFNTGYNKAIDDFVEACDNQFIAMYGQRYIDMRDIKEIAEQLRKGDAK